MCSIIDFVHAVNIWWPRIVDGEKRIWVIIRRFDTSYNYCMPIGDISKLHYRTILQKRYQTGNTPELWC
ncbi:MAG TPA: hypothetical protein VJ911_06930 [Cryomorphaceae bacterium]|nr:hypothetical protein [Cryomorphaceae bacterium]